MSSPHHRRSGFTILEMMLAVTILSVVVVSVYSTWSTSLLAWKRASAGNESFQRQRLVMETLTELADSVLFRSATNDLFKIEGATEGNGASSVSFVTASDAYLPPEESWVRGLRRVTLWLAFDNQRRPFLAIASAPALAIDDPKESRTPRVLSTEVCAFSVRFRDPRDGSWVEQWDETEIMPNAIEFTVGFGDAEGPVPPVVVTQAVELPVADYAMRSVSQASAQSGTNSVARRQVTIYGLNKRR
jgi:general secretion pathway protein J